MDVPLCIFVIYFLQSTQIESILMSCFTDLFLLHMKKPNMPLSVTGGETNADRWPTGSAKKSGFGSFTRFCSWGKTWVKLTLES
jgi:hypothetical protein